MAAPVEVQPSVYSALVPISGMGSTTVNLPFVTPPTAGNYVVAFMYFGDAFPDTTYAAENGFTLEFDASVPTVVLYKVWTLTDTPTEAFVTATKSNGDDDFTSFAAYELTGVDPITPFGGFGTFDFSFGAPSFSPDPMTVAQPVFLMGHSHAGFSPENPGAVFTHAAGWTQDGVSEQDDSHADASAYDVISSISEGSPGTYTDTVSTVGGQSANWFGNLAVINGPSGGGGSNALATQVGLEQFGSAPSSARATQVGFEVYGLDTASMIRATQVGFEQFGLAPSSARATQVGLELFGTPPSFERVTQLGLEIFGSPPVTPQFAEWLDFNPAAGSPAGTLNITFPGSVAINGIWMPTYTSDVNVYANNVFVMTAFASVGSQVVPMPIGTTTVTLTTNPSAASFFVFATTQSINPRGAF